MFGVVTDIDMKNGNEKRSKTTAAAAATAHNWGELLRATISVLDVIAAIQAFREYTFLLLLDLFHQQCK